MSGNIPNSSKIISSDNIAASFSAIAFLCVFCAIIGFLVWALRLGSRYGSGLEKKKTTMTLANLVWVLVVCLVVFILSEIVVSWQIRRIQHVFRRGVRVSATVISVKPCRLSFHRYDSEFKIKCSYSIEGSEHIASKREAANQINEKKISQGTQFRLVVNPQKPKKSFFVDDFLEA